MDNGKLIHFVVMQKMMVTLVDVGDTQVRIQSARWRKGNERERVREEIMKYNIRQCIACDK